jgi:hypothetical protein
MIAQENGAGGSGVRMAAATLTEPASAHGARGSKERAHLRSRELFDQPLIYDFTA